MPREPSPLVPPRLGRWSAPACLMLLSAAFSGCFIQPAFGPQILQDSWFEVWITDAQGPLQRLDVGVQRVFVNQESLQVRQGAFDLLTHQGPKDAILVASGFVSSGSYDALQVTFSGARAVLDNESVDAAMPLPVLQLGHEMNLAAGAGRALLLDINATQSVQINGTHVTFLPHTDSLYDVERAAPEPGGDARDVVGYPSFDAAAPTLPGQELLPLGAVAPRRISDAASQSPSVPPLSDFSSATEESVEPVIDPVTGALPPAGAKGWFVQFSQGLGPHDMAEVAEAHGAAPIVFFGSIEAAYVWATDAAAAALLASPYVTHMEADRPVEFLLASSRTAIRLPDLTHPLLGIKDPAGNPIDGRGVGVAVIDIGIDGTHPDIPHVALQPAGPLLLANYKVESLFTVDVPSTDQTSGHGTHVTGILAGRGVLDPLQRGVAPGIRIFGFGVGEASTTLWTTQALDWIVQNHDKVTPRIKVVQNSWQTSSSYDPNSLTSQLVNRLVAAGVTVVFAAGNKGDVGGPAVTSGECQNPTEGVICVAAYDDLNTGSRQGAIASYSSRGAIATPSTWPDLSAPGSSIRSTAPLAGVVTGASLARYTEMDGTSMAAPHVSGAVALMLQADSGLSPAQIEAILERTAFHFADGGAYATHPDVRYYGSHYAKGHGLLDVYAAVAVARAP